MVDKTANESNREYIFGPVPSRRLGRSLGIDLVPFKTCSYDCVYCQLEKTTNKTVERKEWVPLDIVIEQLKEKLCSKPDYITLSGSGEPTLFSRLDELIDRIKEITDIPVAVLTNGSLLWMPELRKSLLKADLVVPSLDAGNEEHFQHINRPHATVSFQQMLQGLIDFRREYKGQYWLEVFLLDGETSTEPNLKKLAQCVEQISPDHVQVNTVTRPPAESFALPASMDCMSCFTGMLAGKAEIVADYKHVHDQEVFTVTREDILTLLKRRPCSLEDIAEGLGMHRNEVVKYVEDLLSQGEIQSEIQNGHAYYTGRVFNN